MMIELGVYPVKVSQNLYRHANAPERLKQYMDGDFSFLSDYEHHAVTADINSALPELMPRESRSVINDENNAIALHKSLGELPIDFALDPRFWIYLTHNTYKDYTFKRWVKNSEGTIVHRFFGFYNTGTDRAISRNAVARLWWGANMTVYNDDPELEFFYNDIDDEYKYTRLLFSNQDVHQQVVERTFGRSKKIMLSLLYYLDKKGEDYITKKNIVRLTKLLCLHMYNNKSWFLSPEKIQNILKEIISD